MKQIGPTERRALRARAHALRPVVIVASAGLADSVIGEIERCLKAHELIKIRVFSQDRLQREELLAQICQRTGASPVQHIGKILVVYRHQPKPTTPERTPAFRGQATAARGRAPVRRDEAPARRGRISGQQRRSPRPASRSRP